MGGCLGADKAQTMTLREHWRQRGPLGKLRMAFDIVFVTLVVGLLWALQPFIDQIYEDLGGDIEEFRRAVYKLRLWYRVLRGE